jgi:hypothetical protein
MSISELCLKEYNITINNSSHSALIQAHEGITGIKVLNKGEGSMAGKKKGMLTLPAESVRHLRTQDRKGFWSRERMAVRESIRSELQSELLVSTDDIF